MVLQHGVSVGSRGESGSFLQEVMSEQSRMTGGRWVQTKRSPVNEDSNSRGHAQGHSHCAGGFLHLHMVQGREGVSVGGERPLQSSFLAQ